MVEFKCNDDVLLNVLAGQLLKSLPDLERSRLVDALEARLVWGDGPRTIQRLVVEKAEHTPDLAKNPLAWNAYEMMLLHGNCAYTWIGCESNKDNLKVNVCFDFDIRFDVPINPVSFLSNAAFYRPREAFSFVVEDKIPTLKVNGNSFYCGDDKAINLQALANLLRGYIGKGHVRSPANYTKSPFGLPTNPYVLPSQPKNQ